MISYKNAMLEKMCFKNDFWDVEHWLMIKNQKSEYQNNTNRIPTEYHQSTNRVPPECQQQLCLDGQASSTLGWAGRDAAGRASQAAVADGTLMVLGWYSVGTLLVFCWWYTSIQIYKIYRIYKIYKIYTIYEIYKVYKIYNIEYSIKYISTKNKCCFDIVLLFALVIVDILGICSPPRSPPTHTHSHTHTHTHPWRQSR